MLNKIAGRFKDYAPLFLRLGVGIVFVFHGLQKMFGLFDGPGLEGFGRSLAKLGFEPGTLWAVLVAGSELGGGLLIIFGFLTRYAAAALCCVMAVAIIRGHGLSTFSIEAGGFEYAFVLFMASFSLLLSGGGNCSLDDSKRQKKSKESS